MNAGPRATAVFLVLTGLLFAALLVALGWRANASGLAWWVLVGTVIAAAIALFLAVVLARGVVEGRL